MISECWLALVDHGPGSFPYLLQRRPMTVSRHDELSLYGGLPPSPLTVLPRLATRLDQLSDSTQLAAWPSRFEITKFASGRDATSTGIT